MRNKLNVIQINGIKGMIFVAFAAICLFAGFVVFPGLVMKLGWNMLSGVIGIPAIGTVQGVLLWGIAVVSYFAFKKKGFFVEFKNADDLSRDEMDAVMRKIQMERQSDLIARSIMRAREMEKKVQEEMNKDLDIEIKQDNTENEEVHNHEKNLS